MGYFDEVYLKRLNRNGTNQQERIKSREEKEFDNIILKRTKYRASIVQINGAAAQSICSLQPNKNNEKKILYNLMISNSEKGFVSGDILEITQKISDKETTNYWIVLHKEEDITKGYQVYNVLCLESFVNITDEHGNTVHTIPVKFVNSTQNWILDLFQFSKTSYGYREPQGNRSFITHDYDFLKKDQYFNYKEKGWKIMGVDNVSIDNVGYFTIQETSIQPYEPTSSDDILISSNKNFFLNNLGDRYGTE